MQASICPADRQREEEEAASVRMPPLGGKEAFPRLTQSIRTGRRRHSDDPSEAFLSDLRFDIEARRRAATPSCLFLAHPSSLHHFNISEKTQYFIGETLQVSEKFCIFAFNKEILH